MGSGRGWKIALGLLMVLAAVGAGLWFMPSPYIVMAPGITGNLAEMVHVEHGHPLRHGKLLMVAIDVSKANELMALAARLDPNVELVKEQQVTGGLNMRQFQQVNLQMMDASQRNAAVAGERLAGLPAAVVTRPGVLVEGILKGTGAVGHLHIGDVITAVGGHPVNSPQALVQALAGYPVGAIVPVTVRRQGAEQVIPIRLSRIPGDPRPAIGVYVGPDLVYRIPRPVRIQAGNIGGPSAGMMFALAIYDQITGADITHGLTVAGTGEISPGGRVGAIGGVAQKVVTVARAGAQVFLCPVANYPKALAMARRDHLHLRIFPVRTLSQALSDLRSLPARG
ncbi:MAG: PDZ domain-containing protein [Firmicutes bacterium]|nr:PDZ domain-containing protein [Bacillota bacterium]